MDCYHSLYFEIFINFFDRVLCDAFDLILFLSIFMLIKVTQPPKRVGIFV